MNWSLLRSEPGKKIEKMHLVCKVRELRPKWVDHIWRVTWIYWGMYKDVFMGQGKGVELKGLEEHEGWIGIQLWSLGLC